MMHHQPALPIYTAFIMSVIVFLPCSVSGRIFYTHLRTRCLEDCRLYGSEYKCNTITEEGVIDTLYCSPENGQDHKGNECTSPCWKEIKDYYWCKAGLTWGYCGQVKEDHNHYTSKYGEMCYNTCGMHGKSYSWCKTKQGWDYCSIKKNIDYKGKACHQDHPCGKHDEPYYWCKRAEGGWGYCGPVEPNTLQLKNLKVVQHDLLNKSETFAQSNNNSVWGDLSDISEQVSRRLDLCNDYRKIKHNRRSKRLIDGGEVTEFDIDQGKHIATLFIVCPGQNAIADGRTRSNETRHLIACWNNGYLDNQSKSNLITSKNLRIALQGLPYIEGQQYYNLEIHLRQNTTISQILIPRNPPIPIPDRHVRRAFLLSFYYRVGVIVDVKFYRPRLG